jgi:hypothetical protein
MTAEDRGSAYRRCSEGLLYRHWSMDHTHAHPAQDGSESLNRMAVRATLHCLTGCAIGEVLGMVIATALGWGNAASITLSVVLAFLFGYALTFGPILRAGVPFRRAAGLTFASDTASITTMEIVDNAFILVVPGAMAAGLSDSLFWWSLVVSLVIAFIVTVPVNRWLIARGRGHAVVHQFH